MWRTTDTSRCFEPLDWTQFERINRVNPLLAFIWTSNAVRPQTLVLGEEAAQRHFGGCAKCSQSACRRTQLRQQSQGIARVLQLRLELSHGLGIARPCLRAVCMQITWQTGMHASSGALLW